MPFENVNTGLFQMINAPAHPDAWIVLAARILAEWVVYAAVLWMVVAWIRNTRQVRYVLLDGLLTVLAALATGQVIAMLWYHARPFELHMGHQLLPHATVTSFPSDHGLFMFALAFAWLVNRITRSWGWLFLLAGFAVAWSRVYLGIHFPFDMIGAFVISLIWAVLIRLISPLLRSTIYPLALKLYEAIIATLRLPQAIFPRSS